MRYHTVTINIPTGERTFSDRVEFPVEGNVIACSLFQDKPSKPVEIEIEKNNGDTLIESSDTEDWVSRTGGDYISSKKPLGFETQQIKIKAMSTENQTADYSAKLMFLIDENY